MKKKLIIALLPVAFLLVAPRFGYGLGAGDSVKFFDVGQGDSSLVSCGRAQLLIDGGPDRIVLNRLGAAMPFFDRRIEYVLLSHPHDDHVFGLFAALGRYEVGRIIVSEYAAEEWRGSQFIRFAEDHGVEVVTVRAGDTIELCPELRLDIVWPDSASGGKAGADSARANDLSVVGRLSVSGVSGEAGKGVSYPQFDTKSATQFWNKTAWHYFVRTGDKTDNLPVLFTGDITATAERAILDSGADIAACILKVPHHGSRYSSTPEFVRAVDPKLSVIQVGKNLYGQPSATTIRRLEASGSAVHRTDFEGSISANP